jgi:hypothetical protein
MSYTVFDDLTPAVEAANGRAAAFREPYAVVHTEGQQDYLVFSLPVAADHVERVPYATLVHIAEVK